MVWEWETEKCLPHIYHCRPYFTLCLNFYNSFWVGTIALTNSSFKLVIFQLWIGYYTALNRIIQWILWCHQNLSSSYTSNLILSLLHLVSLTLASMIIRLSNILHSLFLPLACTSTSHLKYPSFLLIIIQTFYSN